MFPLRRQLEVEIPEVNKLRSVCVCIEPVEPSSPRPFSQSAGQMRPAPVAPPSGGVSAMHAHVIWSKRM